MQRKDKGFTLVELVVVVATLAIKQMNMSQFQITSPTRTFIIFLAKVNLTILCRTLTMHMKSYLPKINNMRNIRILCRNHKNSLLRPEIKYFRPGREFLSSLSMFLFCNNQICLHCFSSVIKENLPATLQGDFISFSLPDIPDIHSHL